MFSLKSFKNFLKYNPCIAATYKMFPRRRLLYIFPFKNLFMEPTATISLSESTYGTPGPSIILPSDKKMTSQYEMTQRKLKDYQKLVFLWIELS